jgi:uncharacterized protein YqfA (UPF0365 family)
MAAATTILAGTAVVGGIAKAASGAKQKRDATRAARRFRRQELKNVQEGRRVSTLGADLAREEMARATATTTEALQQGGIRGVVGGIGKVQQANIEAGRRIGAGLDVQQVQIDKEIAADEARIRAIQEGRDVQELSAIQQQVNAGQQQMWSGLGDVAAGVGGFAASGGFGGEGYVKGINQKAPAPASTPSQSKLGSVFGVVHPSFTGKTYGAV